MARPLKVGDTVSVKGNVYWRKCEIIHIKDNKAWILRSKDDRCGKGDTIVPLSELKLEPKTVTKYVNIFKSETWEFRPGMYTHDTKEEAQEAVPNSSIYYVTTVPVTFEVEED